MDAFVEHLKSLCREHPTRAKWVCVPGHGVGRTIGDRLVLEGTDWANLRFVTPLDLALRIGAPFLVERGIDPSEEQLGPALIMRLLLGLPETHTYFRPLAHEPRMAMALWSTIRELRAAGFRATDLHTTALHADHFESTDKQSELQALLDAYERHLADHKLGDQATVFEEALKHPEWCPVKPEDCVTLLPGVQWTPLQERLLASLKGERLAQSSTESDDRRAKARRLRKHSFFTAGGPEPEVEEVMRRILASGRKLDEVEIACASDGYSTLLWEKACRYEWPVTLATGLPATLTRPGRALLGLIEWVEDNFAAGKLRRLLQSGDVKMSSEAIFEEISSEAIFGQTTAPKIASELISSKIASELISPGRAAKLLVKANAAWGRATYRLSLTRLATSSRARVKQDISDNEREYLERNAKEAEALAEWIDALITTIPEPGADNHVDLQPLVQAAVTFVNETAARASALDHAAADRLATSINELRALGDFRCPLGQALRFIRERVESLHIGADRPRPGHLHISQLRDAGWPNRPLLFVVGLEEGRVFPAAVEDPVLLDKERESLRRARPSGPPDMGLRRAWPSGPPDMGLRRAGPSGPPDMGLRRAGPSGPPDMAGLKATPYEPTPYQATPVLPSSAEKLNDQVAQSLARLDTAMSMPGTEVHLSYSCRDMRQFRATYASWVMLHAFRNAKGDQTLTYQDLHKETGKPVSTVPATGDQALGKGRWWLHAAAKAGEHAGKAAVLAEFAPLAQGVTAEAARDSEQFTEYDGYVPEAGPVLDPAKEGRVVSPTQLESAAQCPFRHFLERGLGVHAIESGDREQDLWLNPLIRGSLLHDLYADFHTRCLKESRTPVDADHEWLQDCGRALLEKTAIEMPPPSAEVGERESRDFLRDLELFSRAEIANPDKRTPVALEAPFTDHVVKAGDLTFRIRGRIDRIDQLADGTFEILDYKTGSYFAPAWLGTFAGGRRLQHALYGLAAVDLLKAAKHKKPDVVGATYYFSSAKGQQHPKHIPAQSKAVVSSVLRDLRDVIAQGTFIHSDDEDDCKFCDYGAACGASAVTRAELKRNAPELESYRRLRNYV